MSPAVLDVDWAKSFPSCLQGCGFPADAKMSVVVQIPDAPGGLASAAWDVRDGQLHSVESSVKGDVMVSVELKDALNLLNGSVPLAVGFMRGKVKITGDPVGAMLLLRASSRTA